MILNLNEKQEFSPEIASRKTEYILWGAIGLFIGLTIFLPGYVQNLQFWSWLLFSVFVLAGLSISITNWNLRNTKLVLSQPFIEHHSKLRKVSIRWENIDRVQINQRKMGDKIVVSSSEGTFFFDTLGELKIKGVVKETTGFEFGDAILVTILAKTGFTEKDKTQENDYYYFYSRN